MGTQCKHSDLFILDDFLKPKKCAELRTEASQSAAIPARVTKTESRVDIDQRRTSRVFVSPENSRLVSSLLKAAQARIADHYKTKLSGCENPQFLLYRSGDFYKAHRDKNESPATPQYIKDRRLSVVIFLSTGGAESNGFTGGSLVIFGVQGQDRRQLACSFPGKEGQLIAFPSDLKHEVEPVRSGERYSIVSWYF